MTIVRIDDPTDERVRDYFGLTDVALRRILEPAEGLYLAESEKVIRRALAAGHRPRALLMGERWLTDLADVVADAEASGVPVYTGSAEVIEGITGYNLHRGALASMHRPQLPTLAEVLDGAGSYATTPGDVYDIMRIEARAREAEDELDARCGLKPGPRPSIATCTVAPVAAGACGGGGAS